MRSCGTGVRVQRRSMATGRSFRKRCIDWQARVRLHACGKKGSIMTRPLSPIHRPLEPDEPAEPVAAPLLTRIEILAQLDRRVLHGRVHSIGAGGASSIFARAVDKALVEEMADQLRGLTRERKAEPTEIEKWADDIIAAFRETGN